MSSKSRPKSGRAQPSRCASGMDDSLHSLPAAVIDYAVCGRPIAGESESGDAHVAVTFAGGALVGVIDGLGHGPEAASAAKSAVSILNLGAGWPMQSLFEACHDALRGTRGIVLSLASIDATQDELTWAGVGNVDAVLHRKDAPSPPAKDRIIPRNGVVGYRLPV